MFSNFGAINCAPQIDALAADLAPLLEPGAPLVWVVMGRYVPWEWGWYLARGDWRKAFRRLAASGASLAGHARFIIRRRRALARALRSAFRTQRPARSDLCCRRLTRRVGSSARHACCPRSRDVDTPLQRCDALARFADHYIFEATAAAGIDE